MKHKQTPKEDTVFSLILRWVVITVLVASVLLNVSTYVFPVVRYYGVSMSPTLSGNQLLLMNESLNPPAKLGRLEKVVTGMWK